MKLKRCYQKRAPCSLLFAYNVLLSVGYNGLWMLKFIFLPLPLYPCIVHTTYTLQMPTNPQFTYFFFSIFRHFCCLLSAYQNLLRIESLKNKRNVERRELQKILFWANIVILMSRRSFTVCYRFQCNQSLLFECLLFILCIIYTAWLQLKYS